MSKNKYIADDEIDPRLLAAAEAEPAVEENAEPEKTKEKKQEKSNTLFSGRTLIQIMNGEFLTKDTFLNNMPFTFFIGFLLVVVIAWGYYGETVTKHEVQLEKELGELNSEFYTLT